MWLLHLLLSVIRHFAYLSTLLARKKRSTLQEQIQRIPELLCLRMQWRRRTKGEIPTFQMNWNTIITCWSGIRHPDQLNFQSFKSEHVKCEVSPFSYNNLFVAKNFTKMPLSGTKKCWMLSTSSASDLIFWVNDQVQVPFREFWFPK